MIHWTRLWDRRNIQYHPLNRCQDRKTVVFEALPPCEHHQSDDRELLQESQNSPVQMHRWSQSNCLDLSSFRQRACSQRSRLKKSQWHILRQQEHRFKTSYDVCWPDSVESCYLLELMKSSFSSKATKLSRVLETATDETRSITVTIPSLLKWKQWDYLMYFLSERKYRLEVHKYRGHRERPEVNRRGNGSMHIPQNWSITNHKQLMFRWDGTMNHFPSQITP